MNIGSGTTITGNTSADGAGIFNRAGTLAMTGGSITSNLAKNNGGGVAVTNGGAVTLNRVTITGNAANSNNAGGGAAFMDHFINGTAVGNGTLTANFSRIAGNIANGGTATGIRNTTNGTVDATNDWWGADAFPGTAGADSTSTTGGAVTSIARLDLNITPGASSIFEGGATGLTADFTKNSAATTITLANLSTLTGLPLTFGGTGGTISAAQTTIQANGMATATYTAAGATGAGTATAQVDNAPAASAGITVTEITATKTAAVAVNNSGPAGEVNPGDVIEYTITLSNPSGQAATVSFNDPRPANTTLVAGSVVAPGGSTINTGSSASDTAVSISGIAIPASSSVTVKFRVLVPDPAGGTSISNQGTVTRGTFNILTDDPAVGGAADVTTTPVVSTADLSITKTDGVTSKVPGTNKTYTIVVTNAGPNAVTGARVADTFPAIFTGVTFTTSATGGATGFANGSGNINQVVNMPSGSTITYVVSGNISASATGTLVNTATVTAPGTVSDPTPGNNSATDTDTLTPQADLAVTKTDAPDPVIAGNNVTYTISLTNNGASDARTVSLSDALPVGTTFVSATEIGGPAFAMTTPAVGGTGTFTATNSTLAAGASATFTLVAHVNASAASGSLISNTATATTATTDPTPGNNSATATTTINTLADLSITQTDAPDPVIAGNDVIYTIDFANNGASDARNVSLSDPLPAGTRFVSATAPAGWTIAAPAFFGTGTVTFTKTTAASGESGTFQIHVNTAGSVAGTTLTNTVSVSSSTTDPNPANDSATATTATNSTDLRLFETNHPGSTTPGSTFTYNLLPVNVGNGPATGVVLTETLPVGTFFVAGENPGWTQIGATNQYTFGVGDLAPGASRAATFTVHVNAIAAAGLTSIVNSASVADDGTHGPELAPNDNTALDFEGLDATPDFRVTATASGSPALRGHDIIYTLGFSNAGNRDATGAFLTETLPANTTFNAAASSAGWTQTAPGVFRFSIGNLAAGASAGSATFVATVNSTLPLGTRTINSLANIDDDHANGADPITGDNTAALSKTLYQGIFAVAQFTPPQGALSHLTSVKVRVFDVATNTESLVLTAPYGNQLTGSVRVAVGDFNGDGFDDIVTARSSGNGRIRVFDGLTGLPLTIGGQAQVNPGTLNTRDGVFIAAGDVTGDGRADIIVGESTGGGRVIVIDGVSGNVANSFLPFSPTYKGGVQVAVGDVNGDGHADIVATQNSKSAKVKVLDGINLSTLLSFSAGSGNGVNVAVGDGNHDGKADIIAGSTGKRGVADTIKVFSGADASLLSTQNPFGGNFFRGVRVACTDFDLDGFADTIAAAGPRGQSRLEMYSGKTGVLMLSASAFPDDLGLFVAASSHA